MNILQFPIINEMGSAMALICAEHENKKITAVRFYPVDIKSGKVLSGFDGFMDCPHEIKNPRESADPIARGMADLLEEFLSVNEI
jgi:hypothetical protein